MTQTCSCSSTATGAAAKAATRIASSIPSAAAASPTCRSRPRPTSTKRSPPPTRAWPTVARHRGRETRRHPPQGRRPAHRARRPHRRDPDAGTGQAARRGEGRSDRLGVDVQLVCRGDQARLWPHARPPDRPALDRDPPAGRPDRDLHPVEFPHLSAGEKGRRRARRGLPGDQPPAAGNPGLHRRTVPRARRRRHPRRGRATRPWQGRPRLDHAHQLRRSSARSASPARSPSASIS